MLESVPQSTSYGDKLTPPGKARVYRIVIGDIPPESLADFDPCLCLFWADRNGVECETVLVGGIARAVGGVLDGVGLAEGAAAQGILVPFAQSPLLGARTFGARHYDSDTPRVRVGNRLYRSLSHAWDQISERLRHWRTRA